VVLRLINPTQDYAWGSTTAIPEVLGEAGAAGPVAELWMGAHPASPSLAVTPDGEVPLDKLIAEAAEDVLGRDVVARFGRSLPYLLKLIAVDRPLSLQVHPDLKRAREGFATENAAGIPLRDPRRNYKDANHKPELVYALTRFEALSGFRAPRRAAELLSGLDAPLAVALHEVLAAEPTFRGIRTAFRRLLEPDMRPEPNEVQAVADACARRLASGSPSPRADRTVVMLAEEYPGDPGAVTSLLLNPVTLEPGEAMFVPAGGVHAYLKGLAVEVMANSDNVLRAGLTAKHVDVPELLSNVDYVAAPPIRVAPEVFHGAAKVFYAPVDDFELSVAEVDGHETHHRLPGRGPRIVLCVDGEVTVHSEEAEQTLRRGQSVFVPAVEGALTVCGTGTVVQADVP
jgi:mannose-6-phosphate isomerase